MEDFYLDIQYYVRLGLLFQPLPASIKGVINSPEVVVVTTSTAVNGQAVAEGVNPSVRSGALADLLAGVTEATVGDIKAEAFSGVQAIALEVTGAAGHTEIYVAVQSEAEASRLAAHVDELILKIKGTKAGVCKVSYRENASVKVSYEERKVKVSCPVYEIGGRKVGGSVVASGSTVKLRAEFLDYSGKPVDPEEVTLRVYDCNEKEIGVSATVSTAFRLDVGIYEYPFTVPVGVTDLVYEFTGMIEGNPSIGRGTLKRTFGV